MHDLDIKRPHSLDPFATETTETASKPAVPAPAAALEPPAPTAELATGPKPADVGDRVAKAVGLGELAKTPEGPAAAPAPAIAGPDAAAPTAAEPAVATPSVHDQIQALKDNKTVLKPGQRGDNVLLLQKQLQQLGIALPASGVYDEKTANYVRELQKDAGLGADGIAGPKTFDQLMKFDAAPHGGAGAEAGADKVDHMPTDPALAAVYISNRLAASNAKENLSKTQQADMKDFMKNWEKNHARYEGISSSSGIPAKLIAALHWRESTGDFGTYLHQGDPLGKAAVNEPADIPLFKEWEPAAEHALGLKNKTRDAFKIGTGTQDEAALMSYAERYNGLGYHNKGVPSPYVLTGTDQYKSGKFVADGVYDGDHKDDQLGVLGMMRAIDKAEREKAEKAAAEKAKKEGAPEPTAQP